MRWLKRGLWAVAWGCWAWCGFGLYRELPRTLELVCSLPATGGSMIAGFLGDSDQVVMIRGLAGTARETSIGLFDGETGALVRETPGPPVRSFARLPTEDDTEVLYAHDILDPTTGRTDPGLHEFNLATGRWRRLCDNRFAILAFDRARGVALCVEPEVVVRALTFLDVRSGKILSIREMPTGWDYIPWTKIVRDLGVAVLPMAIWPKGAPRGEAVKLEVWSLGPPITLLRTLDVTGCQSLSSASPAGRLALARDGNPSGLSVFDLNEERWVFRFSPDDGERGSPKEDVSHSWTLSPSGRTASNRRGLWDLASGRRLWQRSRHEYSEPTLDGRFLVRERWHDFWKRWLPNLHLETCACRFMDDSRLLFRTAVSLNSFPFKTNAAKTLGVAFDGHVYRLPPLINFPLLALCQAILALPLVLLWAALRWRRKRRLRLVGAAS